MGIKPQNIRLVYQHRTFNIFNYNFSEQYYNTEHTTLYPAPHNEVNVFLIFYIDDIEFSYFYTITLTLRWVAWMVCPCRLFLLLYRPCEGQVRPPPTVQLPKLYVCSGSVGLTRYTSVSTTTWSFCDWATRNWQSNGMLISVKNCSREVLVSRNRSQMALDEYGFIKVCKINKFTCKLEC